MQVYLNLLQEVMADGTDRPDRTGTGRRSIFGPQVKYDLRKGFPVLTTKKVFFKGVVVELLWFLRGDTNVKYLNQNGVSIWDEWADDNDNLGKVYGHQWRSFGENLERGEPGVDQIERAVRLIKNFPDSRRIVVTAWNPAELEEMALPACHCFFQFYPDGEYLDLKLYQRSCDAFLGMPFNIVSYALLLSMVAQVTDLKPRYFIHSFGDLHIYHNHFEQVEEILTREPLSLPNLYLNKGNRTLDNWSLDDIKLIGYVSHRGIRAPIAI